MNGPLVPLEQIARIQKGSTITAKNAVKGDVPVIAGGMKPAYFHSESNRDANAITVSASGAAGYVSFHPYPIYASDCITVESLDLRVVDQRYLFLALLSMQDHLYSLSRGTALQHVYAKDLKPLKIPVPPLEEQKRIVEALDDHLSRIDKTLAELEMANRRSKHLFLAALEQAIEECDESSYQPLEKCLKEIDQKKKVQRGWSPQCSAHPQSNSSVWAVLKTTAVQNMRYEPQHNKELPKLLLPKSHLEVQAGDFLMTTTGPRNRCGVVCLVPSTPAKLIFSGKILRFQPDRSKLLPVWLELVLASHRYQKRLDQLKVGSSDSSVSIGNAQVLELQVPAPSLDEQKRLVAKVGHIKTLAENFESAIEQDSQRFEQLRRSILHAAFSGNLGSK
jgi:restriction endonuclease S subunit